MPDLIISKRVRNVKDIWFYTNNTFNHLDAIDVRTFNKFRSVFRLDKIRRLHFQGSCSEFIHLNVNEFTHLEQLKIFVKYGRTYHVHIDLPKLKIMEIDAPWNRFYISSPKLEILKCMTFDCINLTHPNAINYLEETTHSASIRMLENVQFYQVYCDDLNDTIRSKVLVIFPKLKTLVYSRLRFPHRVTFDDLRSLAYERSQLKRTDLKIYFESVEVDSIREFNQLEDITSSLAFQIDNYKSLGEKVNLYSGINYNELMSLVGGQIPQDLYRKYSGIHRISVTDTVESQVHLYQFLKSFDYLTELNLEFDSLDQYFCDRLYELTQLTKVTVTNRSKSIYNYDFLLKLKLLETFSTTSDSPLLFDLALELFRISRDFQYMRFHFHTKRIEIEKCVKLKKYKLCYRNQFEQILCEETEPDYKGLVRLVQKCRCKFILMRNPYLRYLEEDDFLSD